ncbi:hypothetical protein BDV93DRAFT_566191 [Ceratobasidium sp. AG-I]|nr:hypothetical protein BDV93DRAFT_566191 [Ceratobasidium sp. AG-I]
MPLHVASPSPSPAPPDGDEEDGPGIDENTSLAEIKDYVKEMQISQRELKRTLTEVTGERDRLQAEAASRSQPRRRERRLHTEHDTKFEVAGCKCVLLSLLWVSLDLYDVAIDESYTLELRYTSADMQVQGELRDICAFVPDLLRADFLRLSHFQQVFDSHVKEQRHNSAHRVRICGSKIFGCLQTEISNPKKRAINADFHALLGYDPSMPTAAKQYPILAPLFYKNHQPSKSNKQLFRSDIVQNVFRACMFGASSLDVDGKNKAKKFLAKMWELKSITPAAMAAAATLAPWCISPDDEFEEVGTQSGINWKSDYRYLKKLLIEGVRKEEERLHGQGKTGSLTSTICEWNLELFPSTTEPEEEDDDSDSPSGITAALAVAEEGTDEEDE